MNNQSLIVNLKLSPVEHTSFCQLQRLFTVVCNEVSAVASKNKCWNRVALHHLVYHRMRDLYPNLGSQMICNAIYSVAKACRALYENESLLTYHSNYVGRSLPQIIFLDNSPVYFDRHTLSIRGEQLSMFTLEGRLRFAVDIPGSNLESFQKNKLKDILLYRDGHQFVLQFNLSSEENVSVDMAINYCEVFDRGLSIWPVSSSNADQLRVKA